MTKTQKETVKEHIQRHFTDLVQQYGTVDKVPMQNATKLKNLIIPQVKEELGDKYSYSVGPKLLHTWSYEVSKSHFEGKILCAYQSVHYNVKRPVQIQPSSGDNPDEDNMAMNLCQNCETRNAEVQKLKEQNENLKKELESARCALNAALENNRMPWQFQQQQVPMQQHSSFSQHIHQHQMLNPSTGVPPSIVLNNLQIPNIAALAQHHGQQHQRYICEQLFGKKRTREQMPCSPTDDSCSESHPDALSGSNEVYNQSSQRAWKKRKISSEEEHPLRPSQQEEQHRDPCSPDSVTRAQHHHARQNTTTSKDKPPSIEKYTPSSGYACDDIIIQLCVKNAKSHLCVVRIERFLSNASYSCEEQTVILSEDHNSRYGLVFLQLCNITSGILQLSIRNKNGEYESSSIQIPIMEPPSDHDLNNSNSVSTPKKGMETALKLSYTKCGEEDSSQLKEMQEDQQDSVSSTTKFVLHSTTTHQRRHSYEDIFNGKGIDFSNPECFWMKNLSHSADEDGVPF